MARAITSAEECAPGSQDPKCKIAFGKIRKKLFTGKVKDWIKDSFFSRSKSYKSRGKRGYDDYEKYRKDWKESRNKLKEESSYTNKQVTDSIGRLLPFDQWKKGIKRTEGVLDPDPVKEGYYSGQETEIMPEDIQRERTKGKGQGYPTGYDAWFNSKYITGKGTRKDYRDWKQDKGGGDLMNKGGYIGRAVR